MKSVQNWRRNKKPPKNKEEEKDFFLSEETAQGQTKSEKKPATRCSLQPESGQKEDQFQLHCAQLYPCLTLTVSASLGLAACAGSVPPPTAQLGASAQAIQQAERAGALQHAPAF